MNAAPRKSRAFSRLLIGLTTTGVAAGGLLAYGNYDPSFKNQVNEVIPGFALWTDKAADAWVSVIDYFRPSPGIPKKSEGKVDLVFERNQAKARQSELKKKEPASLSGSKRPASDVGAGEEVKASDRAKQSTGDTKQASHTSETSVKKSTKMDSKSTEMEPKPTKMEPKSTKTEPKSSQTAPVSQAPPPPPPAAASKSDDGI